MLHSSPCSSIHSIDFYFFIGGLITLAFPLPAFAHDTWIVSRESAPATGITLTLDLTSGHRFPQNESAPKPERISEVVCRQFDTELALKPGSAKAKSTTLTVQAVSTGGMTCWLSLKPHTITLEETTVDKYLKEIAASEEIRATWANAPQPRAWTETYSKHAKLIIPGSRTLPQSIHPIGAELEFVPGIRSFYRPNQWPAAAYPAAQWQAACGRVRRAGR